jgi:hypothetical protein
MDDARPQGALSALQAPPTSPEAREWGLKYLQSHPQGVDTSGEEALLHDYQISADEAKAALQSARAKLAAQRMDPRQAAMGFAQAMLAPAKYGLTSGNWANAAGSLGDYYKQQQELERQKILEDVPLAEQSQKLDQGVLNARLALQELKERTQSQMLGTALRATAKPDQSAQNLQLKTIDTPNGKQEVIFDPHTGKISPQGQPFVPGAGAMDDATKDMLYQYWNNTHALPPGFSRKPDVVMGIMKDIANRAAAEGKTDAAIMANSQLMKSRQRVENDFTPGGKLGTALVSTNRVVAHLGDYMDLFNGLQNGDVQAVNYAKNKIGGWFGKEAPIDIKAVAPILGDELTKSIVPGGGGERERETFASNFSAAQTPGQAAHVIHDYLTFLRDQVEGTRYAYEQSLDRHDFLSKYLTPRTREVFGYEHPPGSLTPEQRQAIIDSLRKPKAAAPSGTTEAP